MPDVLDPIDRCPRCGDAFRCGMQDTAPCPCTTVTLSAHVLAALRQRYAGCLCLRCLQSLATADDDVDGRAPPATGTGGLSSA